MTDEEYASAIQGGDPGAMKAFYMEMREAVERSCTFFLGDDPGMKDAVLETFKDAFERVAEQGKPDLPFRPWMSILAVRHCYPIMEKRRKDFEVQTLELEELARKVPVLQEITQDDRERVNFMVRGEIDDIPEPHKQVLLMAELDGLNHLEIAKRLGAAWVTVVSRLFNARAALAERVRTQFKA